jgi:hypothetical protein
MTKSHEPVAEWTVKQKIPRTRKDTSACIGGQVSVFEDNSISLLLSFTVNEKEEILITTGEGKEGVDLIREQLTSARDTILALLSSVNDAKTYLGEK